VAIQTRCQAVSLEGGPWQFVSSGGGTNLFPGCQNMQVQWNSRTGQGTVVSSPSGCVFLVGDIKWTSLNASQCTLSDMVRGANGAFGYTTGDLITNATDGQPHATELSIESEFRDMYVK
jgi:hypothetical protein